MFTDKKKRTISRTISRTIRRTISKTINQTSIIRIRNNSKIAYI